MADGCDIHLDAEQAARLKAVAAQLGLSLSDDALSLIKVGVARA